MSGKDDCCPGLETAGHGLDIRGADDGSLLRVRVQPRSSKNAIVGVHASAVKIKVTPPPEGGRANAACLKLLAGALSLPRSSLKITRGEKERDKVILVAGFTPGELRGKLALLLN